jgi:hypothetical protein
MKLKDYYPIYLSYHTNPICRALHVLGNFMTVTYITLCVLYLEGWLLSLLLLTPFIIYPFAWSGHYFFEKNKPAAFKHPFKAKICDWLMCWNIFRGKS